MMSKRIDLENHLSIKSANEIDKIIAPLADILDIKHFRYLKLYGDGSRVLLSNYPDCIRYVYEKNHYQKMWFDGEFPEYLKEDRYAWEINRLNNDSEEEKFEQELNKQLGLYHGVTFVSPGLNYFEIFSFDTKDTAIYKMHNNLFFRFMLYFKEQANKLIMQGENEKIIIPLKKNLFDVNLNKEKMMLVEFLEKTKINRYYLKGQYSNMYLTSKEAQCIYWLIQGKTAEETAIIENIHVKTVQCHLENIRRKLRCFKQTQIVRIILESGIFNAMDYFLSK